MSYHTIRHPLSLKSINISIHQHSQHSHQMQTKQKKKKTKNKIKKNNQYINIIQQQYYKKLLCILCNKKYENILQ